MGADVNPMPLHIILECVGLACSVCAPGTAVSLLLLSEVVDSEPRRSQEWEEAMSLMKKSRTICTGHGLVYYGCLGVSRWRRSEAGVDIADLPLSQGN